MKINIADNPIMIKYYYNGNIIYKNKTYCFELDICENEQEINWMDRVQNVANPKELTEIEDKIFKQFNKEI